MLNIEQRDTINKACNGIFHLGIAAGIGYLGSWAFKICEPTHGAVFFAISTLVYKLCRPLFDSIFSGPNANDASKFVGVVISLASGVAVSAAITTAIGFPITFQAGLILTCSVVALNILLNSSYVVFFDVKKPVII